MSIEALLRDGLPAKITITTGDDPNLRSLAGPLAIIYGGAGSPHARPIAGRARMRRHVWRVVCVSNTMRGAIAVATLVADLLDGTPLDGSLIRTQYTSPPIEDRDDPSEWRWSITVEAIHYQETIHV